MTKYKAFGPVGAVLLAVMFRVAVAESPTPDAGIAHAETIQNGRIVMTCDGPHGVLSQLSDVRSAHDFLVVSGNSRPLWTLYIAAPDPMPLTPSAARDFQTRPSQTGAPSIEMEWRGFGLAAAPDLLVQVRAELDEDAPEARLHLSVKQLGALRLDSIVFPSVAGIAEQPDEELAVPVWMGERTRHVRSMLAGKDGRGARLEWPYPGILSLQCLALYRSDGPGLYLSCDDTLARLKSFAAFGEGGRAGLEVTHLLEQNDAPAGDLELPYGVRLGMFNGDWFTVAERYREWGLRQPWARDSRLRNGRIPAWATDTALWVWNRGRSGGVLGPAIALAAKEALPISVFWHWWHGCAYDMGFPEYLPPREGEEAFTEAVAAAHTSGVHCLVYMNQRLWGMTTRSWMEENAARFAVKDASGAIRPEVYNTFTKAPCASMCMGTSFWRDKYAGLAQQAFSRLGVDGIYMDQACSSLACYDPAHGHTVGGGSYWIQGFQQLAASIRAGCDGDRRITLAGEGCGEAWLPHLDLMLSLQVSMERYAAPDLWEPIPFFHAVYHGYAVFFGNYSSLTMPPYDDLWPAEFAPKEPLTLLDERFSTQFRLEQARAWVWGQQPAIANFRADLAEQRPREIEYLLQLVRLRQKLIKYLLYGAMLRPPHVDATAETAAISRLSIYAGQQEALKEYKKELPGVLAGAWRADDGDVALVFAGIADQEQRFSCPLEKGEYGIAPDAAVTRIDGSSAQKVTDLSGSSAALDVVLPPRGACAYVFSRPLPEEK